eukprot:2130219-Rhodomonas_salina.2
MTRGRWLPGGVAPAQYWTNVRCELLRLLQRWRDANADLHRAVFLAQDRYVQPGAWDLQTRHLMLSVVQGDDSAGI